MKELTDHIGEISIFVSLVAYAIRIEMKQKELTARRVEDQELIKESMTAIEKNNEDLEKDMKAYFKDAKNSRAEIRTDYKEGDKAVTQLANNRVDIVKADLKEHKGETKQEFKEINEKLGAVIATNGRIEGMVQTLLNQ